MKKKLLYFSFFSLLFVNCGKQIWVKKNIMVRNESLNKTIHVKLFRDSVLFYEKDLINNPRDIKSFEISPFIPLKTKKLKIVLEDQFGWEITKEIVFPKKQEIIQITYFYEKIDSTHFFVQEYIKKGLEINPSYEVLREEELRIEVLKDVRRIKTKDYLQQYKCGNE